jgi:IclR family acetate operon transcriptional repressor
MKESRATNRPGRKPTREAVPVTRTLDRGLSVLQILAEAPGLSLSELARRLDLSPSTVSRLLTTLCERGFVAQAADTGAFRIGLQAFEVGLAFSKHTRLDQVASPILQRFTQEIGDTVSLCIQEGREVIYVDQYEGSGTARTVMQIGSRQPMYCTAAGKVMLAWLWEVRVRDLLGDEEFARFTEHTLTTVNGVLLDLESVRQRGYATDMQELENGVCCVAAPIRARSGAVVGAISASAVASRMTSDRIKFLGPQLSRVGNEISHRLGWRAPDQITRGHSELNDVFDN